MGRFKNSMINGWNDKAASRQERGRVRSIILALSEFGGKGPKAFPSLTEFFSQIKPNRSRTKIGLEIWNKGSHFRQNLVKKGKANKTQKPFLLIPALNLAPHFKWGASYETHSFDFLFPWNLSYLCCVYWPRHQNAQGLTKYRQAVQIHHCSRRQAIHA